MNQQYSTMPQTNKQTNKPNNQQINKTNQPTNQVSPKSSLLPTWIPFFFSKDSPHDRQNHRLSSSIGSWQLHTPSPRTPGRSIPQASPKNAKWFKNSFRVVLRVFCFPSGYLRIVWVFLRIINCMESYWNVTYLRYSAYGFLVIVGCFPILRVTYGLKYAHD